MKWSCPQCRVIVNLRSTAGRIRCVCGYDSSRPARQIPARGGPGTELAALFAELGITEKVGCNCRAVAAEMDRAGVAGCRERRQHFLAKLNDNAKHYNWLEKLAAGRVAWNQGLPLTLGGLFDEAVRRSAAKIRVAFLTPSLLLGGAERWIASLVRHFDQKKILPVAVFVTGTGEVSPVVRGWLPKNFPVLPTKALADNAAHFDCLLSWGHSDLHRHVAGLERPVLDAQHGTIGFGKAQKAIADSAVKAGAYLAAVGEACLETFDSDVRQRVRVVENGAELDRLEAIDGREATRAKLNIPPTAKVVLYIGRFAKEKNLDGLAVAVETLPPEWLLVAAGPQYSVPQQIPALGERLRLLEAQEQLGDLLTAADVFCAPSHHEANSLAVIEAMLAGIPVVTTDYPAVRLLDERHGQLGWRVPLRPAANVLAGAIQAAYESGRDSERVRLARSVALEHYTAAAMAKRWEIAIQEVCDDYHSRRLAAAPALRDALTGVV